MRPAPYDGGMKKIIALLGLFCLFHAAFAQPPAQKLKVFISVDMEGLAGFVSDDQGAASGPDYNRFRRLMMEETNAAIDGALEAGATEIVVNDSHGSMRNLLIEDLRAPAELISNNFKPMGMMQGLDETFDAVIFIGYHAKSGSPVGISAHTGSGTVTDLRINGKSVGEAGMNIYVAGTYNVPVVLISGDQIAIEQAREMVPNIEGAQVKEAINVRAARSLRPEEARRRIRAATTKALKRRAEIKPVKPTLPANFELTYSRSVLAELAANIPTVKRTDVRTITYQASDYVQGYRLLRLLYNHLQVD